MTAKLTEEGNGMAKNTTFLQVDKGEKRRHRTGGMDRKHIAIW